MRNGSLVTIGSFDGVHRGHAALLERTLLEARKRKLRPLALTFHRPPKMVLQHPPKRQLLSTPLEKEWEIRRVGIKTISFLTFNRSMSQTRPFAFFRDFLLNRLKAKGIVVGADFRFGNNRAAGARELVSWGQQFGIPVWVIPAVTWDGTIVSSSRIREAFESNRFTKGLNFLGHPYSIFGRRASGEGLGRRIGFPTINLAVDEQKCLPKGVFLIEGWTMEKKRVPRRLGKPFYGVCNIGHRPTVSSGKRITMELHAFNFSERMNSRYYLVRLVRRLRGEKRFASIQRLITAIRRDVQRGQELLKLL